MNLKYNILLFEDDSDYVESINDLLNDHLDDLGFELALQVERDGNNLDELIETNDWDLILMDYNLNSESPKGDVLISQIRDHALFTEIIFYSDAQKFEDNIKSQLIDGIYFARGRRNLIEKVKKVINLTLKKNQDINNMRGLVIAETIDIETKMDTIILAYFGSDDEKSKVIQKILDPKFDAISTKKKYDLINKICKERIVSLNKEFNGVPDEKLIKLKTVSREFKTIEPEIINIRNILAHVRVSENHKNTLISHINENSQPIDVNDEWCKSTRQNIRKHSANLDELMKQIQLG